MYETRFLRISLAIGSLRLVELGLDMCLVVPSSSEQ